MIIFKHPKKERWGISYDNLEVVIREFIDKFNFNPAFFIVGVSSLDIMAAVRIGEAIKTSNVWDFNINFIYDRTLEDGSWYMLSIKNNEAYQIVL